jgi:proteasome beta subunit
VQEQVVPVLRRHYEQFVPEVPGEQQSGATPATYVLAAGYAEGRPFIVDIDPHGLIGRYEEVGFHAVGSGSAMAQQAGSLLAHFRMTERDVDYGVVAAVRVLDTLRVTSPSIGGPVDIYRLTPDGAQALSEKEIERVRKQVRHWAELESKALDQLFAG